MSTYIRYPAEGGSSVITAVTDTNSIDLTITTHTLSADLKLSATAASVGAFKITNSIASDGLLSLVPIATASLTGVLSSTDWSTFNSKQAAGNYITALTGDGTASGPGSVALTLATVNANVGSFGSATQVAAHTVNAKGLVTAASNVSIQIAESQVTNLTTDLAAKVSTTLTAAHILVGNVSNVATDVAMSGVIAISNAGATSIVAGSIVNADINASAAIAFSKLATLTSANILVGSAGNVATSVAVTGDVTISNAGVTAIATGVIVNTDINASAAIDFSKLATLTSANILVGSAGNVATSVAVTGDVTISNAGVTAIATGVIVNTDVNASAAIAGSKINPDFGSQNILTTGTLTTGQAILGGTATNDSAAAGKIGEYIVATGTSVSLTSNTFKTICSISLTAGDWDVTGAISFEPATGTIISQTVTSISKTDNALGGTTGGIPVSGEVYLLDDRNGTATEVVPLGAPTIRVSLASTTTIYLVGRCVFTVSTLAGSGFIGGRRAR